MIYIPSTWLLVPALTIVGTGGMLVLLQARRIGFGALLVQYGCSALLLTAVMPLRVVLIKVAVGVLTTAILYLTDVATADKSFRQQEDGAAVGVRFRFIAYVIVIIASYGVYASRWIQIPVPEDPLLLGAIFLIASGLFQIGIFQSSYAIGIGMITFVTGFEVVYTALEPSLAMVALLAAVHLGLALVISYLELIPSGDRLKEPEA